MPGTVIHIAVADKVYSILGDDVITNLPLFFGGNIAPDAIHAKKDYQRADKKRSHLCEGVRSYGYGYPEMAELFHLRVNEFIENYYLPATEDKDLYLGYLVHLLVDEFYLLSTYKRIENHLKSNGADINAPEFSKSLADEVNSGVYTDFFKENDISVQEYKFTQNPLDILESVWDYEIRDYIKAEEINISKRWVIDKYFKAESTHELVTEDNHSKSIELINLAAENVIAQLSDKIGL